MSYGESIYDFTEYDGKDHPDSLIKSINATFDELNEKINDLHDRISRCNNYVHGRFDNLRQPNQFILLKYMLAEAGGDRVYINLDNIACITAWDKTLPENKAVTFALRFTYESGRVKDYHYNHALNRDSELGSLVEKAK